jgi:hypothetical protein
MTPVIVLLGSFVVAWGFALILVPRQVESLFRHRLWRIRDELQDHIFDQRLPEISVVEDTIEAVEEFIQHARQIRMATFISVHLTHKANHAPLSDLSELSTLQREIFDEVLNEFYRSTVFKIVAGSPIGVFFLPVWLLIFRRSAKPLAEVHQEYRRLNRVPNALKSNRDRRELATSVG